MKVNAVKVLNDSVRRSYNICLSVSLFKMTDPYRNFGKYVAATIKLLEEFPPGFFMRLYTDLATFRHPDFARIAEAPYEYLEIFIYEYPEFITNKRLGFHDGTFGALMRFLALWDNKLWTEYHIKYIWISDIDISPAFLDVKLINAMEKSHADFAFYSNACYGAIWVNDNRKFPILAGKDIFSKNVKVSQAKFNQFLRDCLHGKYKWLKKLIEDNYKRRHPGEVKTRSVLNGKYIVYGFDEYYTNYIMYDDISQYRRIAQYNLHLGNMKHFYANIPYISEAADEEYKLWIGQKTNNRYLKDLTEKVYNYVMKQDLSILTPRMRGCLADFNTYKDLIDEDSITMGAYIVLEPDLSSFATKKN